MTDFDTAGADPDDDLSDIRVDPQTYTYVLSVPNVATGQGWILLAASEDHQALLAWVRSVRDQIPVLARRQLTITSVPKDLPHGTIEPRILAALRGTDARSPVARPSGAGGNDAERVQDVSRAGVLHEEAEEGRTGGAGGFRSGADTARQRDDRARRNSGVRQTHRQQRR